MATPEDVRDVLDTRREFSIDIDTETVSYFIANPTGEDIRKADWQYSKIYNRAILDDLLTQAQMIDLLKKQGVISEDYASEVEETRSKLAAEIYKLESLPESTSDLQMEDAALVVAASRDELFRLNQRVNGPMGNTCENIAEDARVEFLTSRVLQLRDGTPVWKDYDEYLNEENTALSVKSRFEVMLWMQGLNSDFLENTPEQQTLRDVNQKRVESALAGLKAERESADEEDLPDEAEVEILELPPTSDEPNVKAETTDTDAPSDTTDTAIVETEEAPVAEKPKPKRKGRPKGSKNKKKAAKPETTEEN
jgi:hypothetical protein